MKCLHCGKGVSGEDKICPFCGEEIENVVESDDIKCRHCGKLLKEDFNICPYCGTPRKIVCSNCKKELEEEYSCCPFCGEKIGGKSAVSKDNAGKHDYMKKFTSVLAAMGKFFIFIGRVLRMLAITFFEWLVKIFNKALGWFRSLDWGTLKNTGNGFMTFAKKIFSLLKQGVSKAWVFLKGVFIRLRVFISGKLERKLSPDSAEKAAIGIITASGLLSFCLLAAVVFGVFSPSGQPGFADGTGADEPEIAATLETTQPIVDPSEQKWLVMIYADADDEVLENDIYFDVNEAETAGSTERVQIVAQIDRFQGGYDGDGDWSGTRRYFITKDDDLNVIRSDLAMDLGEVDMGATNTLVDFATWAIETYPADRYVLIMSDHGSGWPGGWYDDDSINPSGNFIALNQMDAALSEIIAQTGIGKFELVGMDACLMGMLEVYSMLEPHALYAVASEEYEPGMGWAYSYFLKQLVESPEMDGADLAGAIVDGFIHQDLRIRDSIAYKELLADYDLPQDIDEELIAGKLAEHITLSAVNLSVLPELNNTFNQLILALKESDQGMIAEARSYAQAFLNIFDDELPSPYIDLKNFLNIVAEKNTDQSISGHIANVESAYDKAVVAEVHGSKLPGASGISIYFPVSQHYWEGGVYSYERYSVITERFSKSSLWDDFLAFHYAGQDFGQGVPSIDTRTIAPGYSEISISPPVITPSNISVDHPEINIQVDIGGDRIAYIYFVSMYRYEDRLLFYQSDYILGDENMEVNGVVYPSYQRKNGVKHVNLDYEITATAVTDGKTAAFAVLEPEVYGLTPADIIYSVKGFYVYSETGQKVSARMYFYNYGDNEMRNIVGYFGNEEHGTAPAEINPKKGDQFTFLDSWWVVDEEGDVTDQLRDGNTLTFGDTLFQQGGTPEFVYPGEYFLGIGVEDMDGNQTFSFSPVTLY